MRVWFSRRLGLEWYPPLWELTPDIAQGVMWLDLQFLSSGAPDPPPVSAQLAVRADALAQAMREAG